ncbi:MAG: flagellar motor protein MotB [Phycisphaerae bacterium]
MAGRERKPSRDEDSSNGTPGWIVSWTDMVTLLLSFFVMLQSMAVEKSDMLFQIGRGSFIRAISGFGIPDWLHGHEPPMPSRQYKKVMHSMEKREASRRDRVIDAEAERIRELFMELRSQIETETSDSHERHLRSDALEVRFTEVKSDLGEAQRELLVNYADNLRRNLSGRRIRIYAVGLAPDVPSPAERAKVAALRARSAEKVLHRVMTAEIDTGQWELGSWGAADGASISRQAGVVPGEAQIIVVVMEVN